MNGGCFRYGNSRKVLQAVLTNWVVSRSWFARAKKYKLYVYIYA